jgi:hypothetical protein
LWLPESSEYPPSGFRHAHQSQFATDLSEVAKPRCT